MDCGTALIMSSESEEMNGISMIPITRPAVMTDDEELPSPSRLGDPVANEVGLR